MSRYQSNEITVGTLMAISALLHPPPSAGRAALHSENQAQTVKKAHVRMFTFIASNRGNFFLYKKKPPFEPQSYFQIWQIKELQRSDGGEASEPDGPDRP